MGLTRVFACGVVLCACGGTPADAVRPKDPTYAGAVGEGKPAICHQVGAAGTPLIVDWKPEDRGDLEVAMKQGVAVVHYDCDSVKLLSTCKVEGTYPYIGMSRKEQVIDLTNADEVKANLPLQGGAIGGGLSRGSSLDIGLVMVGKRSTTLDTIQKTTLSGTCDGATHFVRSATLGAFAMKTSTSGSVHAAGQLFGVGAAGSSDSTRAVDQSDGDIDACKQSDPDGTAPPKNCRALLRLELVALGDRPDVQGPKKEISCPEGLTAVDGKCTQVAAATVPVCGWGDQDNCQKNCLAGSLESCASFILSRQAQGRNAATPDTTPRPDVLAPAQKACDGGDNEMCGLIGESYCDGSMGETDLKKGADLLDRACRAGLPEYCDYIGSAYSMASYGFDRDVDKAAYYFHRGCFLGSQGSCTDYAARIQGKDPAGAIDAFKMACEADQPQACENLGYTYEKGIGVPPDPAKAKLYYKHACALPGASPATCTAANQ